LQHSYFQQNSATAHTTLDTIAFLREFFDDRLISLHTQIEPRSLCLTVIDYFVFPYLKNSIFRTLINNLQEFQQRIVEECATIMTEMLQ
ncbi:hypothetical protein BDFB_015277, partial [Asbolus verrucosus]